MEQFESKKIDHMQERAMHWFGEAPVELDARFERLKVLRILQGPEIIIP